MLDPTRCLGFSPMLLNLNFESSSDVIVGILIVLIRCAATEIFLPMFVAEKVQGDF